MRGDREALEEFVRHYERRVFAFLYRAMGPNPALEDLAQDVFLCALRALPRFETGRAKVSTWLFQIAVHRMRDEFRRHRPSEELRPETLPSEAASPEAGLTERETLHWVQAAVADLPEDQRVALVLYEFHDMNISEVSEVLSTSPSTVRTRIFRARQKLLEAYARHNSETGRSRR